MMTFNKLHEGIEDECKCLEDKGIAENHSDTFTRALATNELTDDVFHSYHELKAPLNRPLRGCAQKCKARGVSINKLVDNREDIKSKYETIKLFSPKGKMPVEFVCSFRFVGEAGMVWDDSSNHPELHHTLLKCDDFAVPNCIEIVRLCPLEEF